MVIPELSNFYWCARRYSEPKVRAIAVRVNVWVRQIPIHAIGINRRYPESIECSLKVKQVFVGELIAYRRVVFLSVLTMMNNSESEHRKLKGTCRMMKYNLNLLAVCLR